MIYGEIGAYPMFVYIKLRMVNYWSKLINGKDSKLSLILYKYMYIKNVHANHGQYQSSWFDRVKSILHNCGFSNIWESQGNFNSTWLNITLKLKLFYKFQQEWRSNMENSSKGLYYKLFKENFEFEPYLNILTYKNRITFCKLELVIIDYQSKQDNGMVFIMGIDCVIYARMQR